MTLDEAHAAAAKTLGAGVRVHFFQGTKTRSWWALASLLGVHDPDGNAIEWAEHLGYLTPVTVGFFARDAARELGIAAPKSEAPAAG